MQTTQNFYRDIFRYIKFAEPVVIKEEEFISFNVDGRQLLEQAIAAYKLESEGKQ